MKDDFIKVFTSNMLSTERRGRAEMLEILSEVPSGMVLPLIRMRAMRSEIDKTRFVDEDAREKILDEYIIDESCKE